MQYCLSIGPLVRYCRQDTGKRSQRGADSSGAAAVVVATLISGLFELNLGDSEVLMTFLAVAACGYVAADTTPGAAMRPHRGGQGRADFLRR